MDNDDIRTLTYSFPEMDSDLRTGELIVYIAQQSMDDPRFGAIKLNRLLFFADVQAYRRYGKPVTGGRYVKMPQGPVPENMKAIRLALEDRGRVKLVSRKVYEFEEHRVVALDEPNLDLFSARDIAILDDLIRVYWGKSADEISLETHGIAWEAAQNRGFIPYEAMLLSDEGMTEDDAARAQELIQRYGWDV